MNNLFSFSNIYGSYLKCRRKKRGTTNALRFESRLEDNICELENELKNKSYQPSRSVCFVAKKPKFREIFAANFKDRVVHHVLVGYLEKIFEPLFIYDSWACRKNKGNQAAVKRLQTFTAQVTSNGMRKAYYMQLDIRSFFVNIDKDILYDIVRRKTDNPDILWLLGVVLYNDCTQNYFFKGARSLIARIPPHKTLFNAGPNRGLPIGNLTSQFFANVYLNELDQFVKHNLKAKHYLRYADDFVLLSRNAEQLSQWRGEIEKFLQERLDITLNSARERLLPVSDGIDFLGYITRPDYLLVRRRVVGNCRSKLSSISEKLKSTACAPRFPSAPLLAGRVGRVGAGLPARCGGVLRFTPSLVEETKSALSSYMAHFNLANSHNLRESIKKRFVFVEDFLKFCDLTRPRFFPNETNQRDFFLKRLAEGLAREPFILFFQTGCFYEFYGFEARKAVEVLGLRAGKDKVGTCPAKAGFPTRLEKKYAARAAVKGYSVYVVGQS
ncbi:MAG: reverse transcriptase domain-containing protein, partial [Endomicrobiia bacterium]|nr:reverse transcriptase domain-containing protein [Endomicrobiia bacterium]